MTELAEAGAEVLIVDDDSGVAHAIKRILVQRNMVVDLACDGSVALEKVDARAYEVIVLDLRMSHVDGLDVLKALRARPNPPETILHSAYLDVRTAVEAMKFGVADVIEKPVSSQALGDRVWDLVRKRRSREDASATLTDFSPVSEADPAARLLGDTAAIATLRDQVRRIAQFRDVSVLIEGQTGTGKELVAEAIHAATGRDAPFVSVNCAAIPDNLFESELFGHEAGAYTSAKGARAGLLEEAGNGTIFLDEIGEMPANVQPKLLRVLETREFRRVGGNRIRKLSARVVSATNRPLSGLRTDPLRSDLYFRLAGYTIVTPLLRDRSEDIPILARNFLGRFAARYALSPARLSDDALEALTRYEWPGNVRELKVVVENAAVLAAPNPIDGRVIETLLNGRAGEGASRSGHSGAFPTAANSDGAAVSLPALEREVILEAFSKYSPNLSKTAKVLGIPRSTLRDRLRKLGAL
ncbi:MAG TPA: sigma-54 dependent transcriptional regulator [Polyangiaceae bacterium]|nr:sigma-54 dependent transcriptional regulator [Polyangiaceae bacterium]